MDFVSVPPGPLKLLHVEFLIYSVTTLGEVLAVKL